MLVLKNKFKGIIHFIGIGGIGMSGIAELMNNQGYSIQGSDISKNNNIKRLEKKNIKIFYDHKKNNLKNVKAIVYSSAIKANNPEILEGKRISIPLVSRAEMLAELMRNKKSIAIAGSHGKTTTTSLIGHIFEEGKKDPTIVIGGIINSFLNNNRLGKGDWMIVEADESDGSFLRLPHEINVITNIDFEHLDYYKNIQHLISSFKKFSTNIPFYGFSVICINNKFTRKIVKEINTRRIITYDYKNKNADVNIIKITSTKNGSLFSIRIKENSYHKFSGLYKFRLNLFGKHNILNATASIVVAMINQIPIKIIEKSLKNFQGVKRRFSYLGKIKKSEIYDDYAHHPEEIKATYEIAKIKSKKKIIVIFQPHRFSRTKELYIDFLKILSKIDILYISDIYSAGEKKIKNINSNKLVKDLKRIKKKNIFYLKNKKEINNILKEYYEEENLIVFMGAGSISNWAYDLIEDNVDK